MLIPANQVAYRRRIGRLGGRAVYGIGAIGGLHLVAAASDSGGLEVLGAGSHPGIARHIAKKSAAEIEFDSIAKHESIDIKHFEDLVPTYEVITAQIRKAQGL